MINDAGRPTAFVLRVRGRVVIDDAGHPAKPAAGDLWLRPPGETAPKRAVPERPNFSKHFRKKSMPARGGRSHQAPAGLDASSVAVLALQMLIQYTLDLKRTVLAIAIRAIERSRCPNPVRNFHMSRPCVLRGELLRAPMMRTDIW